MKISDKIKRRLSPGEYDLMILRAVRGSALIEGMDKSAEELEKVISEKTKSLASEKKGYSTN